MVMWLLLHLAGDTALGAVAVRAIRRFLKHRSATSRKALLVRITRLEAELGLGVDWALDRLGGFAPVLSRPQVPGYDSLRQYAFKCYGCDAQVVYADYDKQPRPAVRDKRHLLCNDCLPMEWAA